MALLSDLNAKRVEMNDAIAAYKQALIDYAAGSITLAQRDAARSTVQARGDEYAKLTAQVKQDDASVTNDDQLFSNPSVQSSVKRENVGKIMRTGSFFGPELKLVVDTEAHSVGETNVILSFDTGADITIDWGDGTSPVAYTGAASHNYATPGIYEVNVTGTVNGFTAAAGTNSLQITDVKQWGDVVFNSARSMFHNRTKFTITALDAPKFAPGASCANMFYGCNTFNEDITHWDMANVADVTSMFLNCAAFNQPIGVWNVSGVTIMNGMFYQAGGFNQPLNNWDVSNVTSTYQMFRSAVSFNQPLNLWNTANVTNMTQMFMNADAFLQDLSMWSVAGLVGPEHFSQFAFGADLYESRTDLHPNGPA